MITDNITNIQIEEVPCTEVTEIIVTQTYPTTGYTIDQIDDMFEEIKHKRTTFTAINWQTSFDMGQAVVRIDNVTRNWVDLSPDIFSISSPFITYNPSLNWGNIMSDWDVVIFNYI